MSLLRLPVVDRLRARVDSLSDKVDALLLELDESRARADRHYGDLRNALKREKCLRDRLAGKNEIGTIRSLEAQLISEQRKRESAEIVARIRGEENDRLRKRLRSIERVRRQKAERERRLQVVA